MGRVNKKTEGVFVDIVGSETEISSYDAFLNFKTKVKPSKELNQYVNEYKTLVNKHKNDFEKLSKLEEIIMQFRSKESMDGIKISIVREYIYARCPFFRKGKTSKDIRVLVDKWEFWTDKKEGELNEDEFIDSLHENTKFMDRAKSMLLDAMELELHDNTEEYKTSYKLSGAK